MEDFRQNGIKPLTDSRLANLGARQICKAFKHYQQQFMAITERAKTRFEQRDWVGTQNDARERLDLYKTVVDQVVNEIRQLLDSRTTDKLIWLSIKAAYSGLITDRHDWELAETFFNSITRRIFATVGVDPQIEFIDTDFDTPPTKSKQPVYKIYRRDSSIAALIESILYDFHFDVPYVSIQNDANEAAKRIKAILQESKIPWLVEQAEVVNCLFYRGKAAYIVGRLQCEGHYIPLAMALLNTTQGIVVDAVLLDEPSISILFSMARSYFHVKVQRPYDLVEFLKTILPHKRVAELYISLGYNKHGKTALYRDLMQHLATATDQFEVARGLRGMVMLVFTLPSFDVVFKIIKDRFAYPKTTTREGVMRQYQLVFRHDRAGRLIDAQEFEHLKISKHLFAPALLDELLRDAARTVTVEDDFVIIRHVYIERRVTPLNLYLQEADTEAARRAVIDCGNAIKDLAITNIFTGDMLLKNFGVTRHGRVVFYDYDELSSLLSCNFRTMPESDNYDDELSAEPWFSIGEHDVFPEEFPRFLGLHGELREWFERCHGDLFKVGYWQEVQNRLQNGEIFDIFPYDLDKHLPGPNRDEYFYSRPDYAAQVALAEVGG